jgi:hypothetical protein
MIYIQEVSESTYHDFAKLPNGVRKALLERNCEQCDEKLIDEARINYVLTSDKKVIWWHNHYK